MDEQQKPIQVTVLLEEAVFRRFAVFDAFKRQKRWRAPAIFAGIMLAFAIVCFCLSAKKGATLIGSVLAIVGLGLPAVYFAMFFSSLKAKIADLKLPKRVYNLTLSDVRSGVYIHSVGDKDQEVTLDWDKLRAAYRDKGCIYLFITPSRAFLLPDQQATVSPGKLWAFMQRKMGKDKCFDISEQQQADTEHNDYR